MKSTGGDIGRVFFLRLEDGDVLHESVEQFARAAGIRHGVCWFLGGADTGSRLIVGPEDGRAEKIIPTESALGNVHEAAGVGTIVPNEAGEPILHMHAVFGRGEETRAGCVRAGVKTWLIGEVVVLEVLNCVAVRRRDPASGFELLETDQATLPPGSPTRPALPDACLDQLGPAAPQTPGRAIHDTP